MTESQIRLIVGLGNPGANYQDTRHNAGYWFVDRVARSHGVTLRNESKFHGLMGMANIAGVEVRLLQPMTFMNRSGRSVAAVSRYFDILPEQILVVHDELDLPPGQVRLKQGGGHAGHNGLRDLMSALGSRDFWRLRVGIDHPGDRSRVVDYVLNRPGRDEARAIEDSLEQAEESLADVIAGRYSLAMNRLHARQ